MYTLYLRISNIAKHILWRARLILPVGRASFIVSHVYTLSGLRHGIGQHVGAILLDSHFIEGAGHSENLGRREYAKNNALCRQYCHSPILQKEKTPHHDIITTTIAPPPHKEDSPPV